MQNNFWKKLLLIGLPTLLLVSVMAIGNTLLKEAGAYDPENLWRPVTLQAQRAKRSALAIPKVFIPSMEVSADKPVSFPADI